MENNNKDKKIRCEINDFSCYGIYNGFNENDIKGIICNVWHQFYLAHLPREIKSQYDNRFFKRELENNLKELALENYVPYPEGNWNEEYKEIYREAVKVKEAKGYALIEKEIVEKEAEKIALKILEENKETITQNKETHEKNMKEFEERRNKENKLIENIVAEVLSSKKTFCDGLEISKKIKITDTQTGEQAIFNYRYIEDFGTIINPCFSVADGLEPGGIETNGFWKTKIDGDWKIVRELTILEKKAITYIYRKINI